MFLDGPEYRSQYSQADKPRRDVRRPEVPYYEGQILSIKRHVPMEPFGIGYQKGGPQRRPVHHFDIQATDVEWYLSHPLIETPAHHDQTVHQLHIGKSISIREDRAVQVVRCKVDGDGADLVAKIYDPLYYPFVSDITWEADRDYSQEAAAYEDLQKSGQDGVLVPKYYGSWTVDMPLLEPSATLPRPVRMILIQWIDAESMFALTESDEAYKIDPKRRLDMLGQALEAKSKLQFYGIQTRDFAPRNILVAGHDTPDFKVWLIDFNHCIVRSRPRAEKPQVLEERPISPLYFFWDHRDNEFIDWLPVPHRHNTKVYNGWLMSVWGDGKREGFGTFPESWEMRDLRMGEGTYTFMEPLPDVGKHTNWG